MNFWIPAFAGLTEKHSIRGSLRRTRRRHTMDLFKNNVGKTDRIIRVILGVLLIGNVFFALQHPIGWLGVILVLTGLAGICPVYSLLGINTKSAAERVGLK